jgi:RND family efflux transporter MFP subunit
MTRMPRLLVAVTLVACSTDARYDSTGVEPTLEPVASPTTATKRGNADFAGYIGVLTPRSSAEVVAPFTTTVTEISVKLGDRVEKGQTLGRIDDRPLREELAIAQATLKATQAEAAQADIEHRAATTILDRERRAFKDSVASMAQVNAAEFNERKAAMAVARGAAAVEEQRAKIAQLKAKLVDTTLVAPLAGEVALSYVQAGEHVEEGHPVIRVISSSELFVKFAISADKAGTLAPGAVVDVVLEPPGTKARAVVRHVAPELDPIAQMILADADLVEPPPQLQSGMVCRIVPRS